jgi:hypothetical protein
MDWDLRQAGGASERTFSWVVVAVVVLGVAAVAASFLIFQMANGAR